MIHDLQINLKEKKIVERVNSYLHNQLLTLQNNSIQRCGIFLWNCRWWQCESAPGLGKVCCLPFWVNPWEYFCPFRLHCPWGSQSWVANGASWQALTHKKSKKQLVLIVKLEKDHLSCAWSHLRKWWNPCFEMFLLPKNPLLLAELWSTPLCKITPVSLYDTI